MTQPAIRVEGLNLVVRRLKALDAATPDKVKELNRRAGEVVEVLARPLVPVLKGGLLGTLRSGATRRSGYVALGRGKVKYAPVIHFGWPARNIEPRPFLYHALDIAEPAIAADYERGVKSLIREAGL